MAINVGLLYSTHPQIEAMHHKVGFIVIIVFLLLNVVKEMAQMYQQVIQINMWILRNCFLT